MQQSMFSSEEPHANHSQSPDFAKAWLTLGGTSHSPILQSLIGIAPPGWYGRTSPVCCQQTEEGHLEPFSGAWASSGMGSPTGFWTLNTSEHADTLEPSRKGGAVCSLSHILETGDVPQRYYLTPKACAGILRRAEKRGKKLPPPLFQALQTVAQRTEPEVEPPKKPT